MVLGAWGSGRPAPLRPRSPFLSGMRKRPVVLVVLVEVHPRGTCRLSTGPEKHHRIVFSPKENDTHQCHATGGRTEYNPNTESPPQQRREGRETAPST